MNYEPTKRRQRRHHSPQFKAQLVSQCLDGASLSGVAVDNGINPNLLRRWVLEHERLGLHALDEPDAPRKPQAAVTPSSWLPFVPVTSAPEALVQSSVTSTAATVGSAQDTIRVEVAGDRLSLSVHWPTAQSEQLARWMRALLA